jgi:signal transduction histidine kinase
LSKQDYTVIYVSALATAAIAESDDPFDDTSWWGVIMNWIAKLFLWFIYLTLVLMILSATGWFLTKSGFWSWVVTLIGAFFYAMLAGRYFGYTACLIISIILFSGLKIFFTSRSGRKRIYQPTDQFSGTLPAGRKSQLSTMVSKLIGSKKDNNEKNRGGKYMR